MDAGGNLYCVQCGTEVRYAPDTKPLMLAGAICERCARGEGFLNEPFPVEEDEYDEDDYDDDDDDDYWPDE